MIGLGYTRVVSFDPRSSDYYDKIVVYGRASLTSISIHSQGITTAFTINPLVFKNRYTWDIRYKVAPWAFPNFVTTGGHHQSQQVFMGGAGILFEDGIYFNWEDSSASDDMGVDNVVLFYT